MKTPQLSDHFSSRKPSPIRQAQILFAQRPDRDEVNVINVAIGNVSRPMHPAMQARMRALGQPDGGFADGVLKYTASVGTDEARQTFLHIIASAGFPTEGLDCVITDGGSQAMELMVLGLCGPVSKRPLMVLDPAYTNYMDMARRAGVPTVSVRRELETHGSFAEPDLAKIESVIEEARPAAVVIIPADNPTGHFMPQEAIDAVARLCVKHDLWLVSDEAYRQLHYTGGPASSVWGVTEESVPGTTGRRLSIESASKVWSACGLRIGGIVTDNPELHQKTVAEYTANLCANAIGQHIFGALAHVPHDELRGWYAEQREYYVTIMKKVAEDLHREVPGIIVSNPDAALYSVVDVREVAEPGFDSVAFVRYCAQRGRVALDGADYTLLAAPMGGFYNDRGDGDPGHTQLRIAFVEDPAAMEKFGVVFAALLRAYEAETAR